MGKKIIGMTGLVVLISLAVFVYASTIDRDINLVKGWNLVPGFYHPNQMFGDDILPDNIKAVYILKQPDQEYVRVYPDQETDKLIGIDDDYYEKTSQWVYSDKSGPMEYFFEEPGHSPGLVCFVIVVVCVSYLFWSELTFDCPQEQSDAGREHGRAQIVGNPRHVFR